MSTATRASAGISEAQVASCLDSRVLELILLPTEKCNFRCTYCYEDFQIGRMSDVTIAAIEKLIENRARSLKILHLGWFGGEPLAAKDVLLRIARHAKKVSLKHDISLSGGMTTNGFLLNAKLIKDLHDVHHDSYQITLDGDQPQHDLTRIRANGSGTFQQIWKNLCLLRDFEGDLHVLLRMHVSGQNTASLLRLLEKCDRELTPSGKFSIHFHRISDLGGPGGASVAPLSWGDYKEILAQLQPRTDLTSSSEVALVEQGEICYAAKPNSLLIRADGRVGKCTVALNDPRNDVGILLEDGTLKFNDRRLQLWFDGFSTMDAEVLGCPLSKLGYEEAPAIVKASRPTKRIEAQLTV